MVIMTTTSAMVAIVTCRKYRVIFSAIAPFLTITLGIGVILLVAVLATVTESVRLSQGEIVDGALSAE